MSVYKSIAKGLQEAIDFEKGEKIGARRRIVQITPLPHFKGSEVKEIRLRLNLSQASFADLMGVSVKTIEAWECMRNTPQGPAQRMLELLKNEQKLVFKYVTTE